MAGEGWRRLAKAGEGLASHLCGRGLPSPADRTRRVPSRTAGSLHRPRRRHLRRRHLRHRHLRRRPDTCHPDTCRHHPDTCHLRRRASPEPPSAAAHTPRRSSHPHRAREAAARRSGGASARLSSCRAPAGRRSHCPTCAAHIVHGISSAPSGSCTVWECARCEPLPHE